MTFHIISVQTIFATFWYLRGLYKSMLVESLNDELFTPLHYSDNIRCCKGKGVFYLMFEVTVSMLPLYTKPLRAYIVELLNAHVVCNLVDLSQYQHNGASLDLDLPVCVD